jgi:hypothetical protein
LILKLKESDSYISQLQENSNEKDKKLEQYKIRDEITQTEIKKQSKELEERKRELEEQKRTTEAKIESLNLKLKQSHEAYNTQLHEKDKKLEQYKFREENAQTEIKQQKQDLKYKERLLKDLSEEGKQHLKVVFKLEEQLKLQDQKHNEFVVQKDQEIHSKDEQLQTLQQIEMELGAKLKQALQDKLSSTDAVPLYLAEISFGKSLGEGNFGKVYEGKWSVALKTCEKSGEIEKELSVLQYFIYFCNF